MNTKYTNRTPCTLIKLMLTDGSDSEMSDDGQNRSVGVEGDADQSIDSFRAADEATLTMVKLEEKLLLSTCGEGKPITLTRCDDGIAEAEALMQNMRMLKAAHPDLS